MSEPVSPELPWVRRLSTLDEARDIGAAGPRLDAMVKAGQELGASLRDGPRAVAVRTLDISTLVYPTKFAFYRAVPLPVPFVVMTHRCLLVQVGYQGDTYNILFNPTDREASKKTPYFKQMLDLTGEWAAETFLAKKSPTVEEHLGALGLAPEDIDLIAFDHFHTQDMRPLLGSTEPDEDGRTYRARFPNAYLLAPRAEWEDWDHLHPLQRAWFIKDGKRGAHTDRVILTDADLALGEGCVLLRTPGHTSGNQTLFVHGESGVFGCCENGCSADSWSPFASRIPGLARHARTFDIEVIMNTNTPELGVEQYNSMMLERSVASRVADQPELVQMFPSSEVTPSTLSPGIRPTLVFGNRDSGRVQAHRRTPRVDRPGVAASA